jgi:hypothetical protein
MDFDTIDWEKVLRQQMERQGDTKAPFNAGLLAAGLGMLANSRGKSFGEALGGGGLLGLTAYQQEKERQMKDPAQLIALATAVENLKEMKQGREAMDWLRNRPPAATQFAPAPGLPEDAPQRGFGMFNRDTGASDVMVNVDGKLLPTGAYLGSMQQPPGLNVGGGINVTRADIPKLLGMIGLPKQAGEVSKFALQHFLKDPAKLGGGESLITQDLSGGPPTIGPQQPSLEKNTMLVNGQLQPVPNAAETMAALVGPQKRAEAEGTARGALTYGQTNLPLATGGGVDTTGIIGYLARKHNVEPGLARDVINTFPKDEDKWDMAIQMIKNASGGTQGAPRATQISPTGEPLGGTPPPVNPAPRPNLYGQPPPPGGPVAPGAVPPAGPVAPRPTGERFGAPNPTDVSFATEAGKYAVENFKAGHVAAESAAYQELPSIYDVRQRIAKGAFTGGGAETKTEFLNFVNGWFGTNIASEQLAQSMALRSSLGMQLLAHGKDLGTNATREDAARIDNIVGKEGLSERALLEIAAVREKLARQVIERHNARLDQLEEQYKARSMPTDVLLNFRVKVPEFGAGPAPAAPQPPMTMTDRVLQQMQDALDRKRRQGGQ